MLMPSLFLLALLGPDPLHKDMGADELWSAPLGPGFSSPALDPDDPGQVVASFRDGESMVIAAFARENGRQLFGVSIPDAAREGQEDYGGGRGPHATPRVHGGAVFTIGYGGTLVCLDARTGARRWERDLVSELGAVPVQFGFAASPVVEDGVLYVLTGGEAGLTAFDPESGEVLWRSAPFAASYVTPVLARLGGVRQLVALFEDETVGFDPASGSLLWSVPHVRPDLTNYAMLRVLEGASERGVVLVSGQGNLGTRRIDVRHDGEDWTPEVRWHARGVKLSHGRILVDEGFLYGSNGSMLCGLRLEDGAVAFKERGFGQHTLVSSGEHTACLDEEGRLRLLELAPERIGVCELGDVLESKAWASPLFHDGVLYARDGERLVALRLPAASSLDLRMVDTGYEPGRITLPPALLAFAQGSYRTPSGEELVLRTGEGVLELERGQETWTLEPRSESVFEGAAGCRLELQRGEQVIPIAILWSEGGGAVRAVRGPIRELPLDRELGERFLGSWVVGPEIEMQIREGEGGWRASSSAYRGVEFAVTLDVDRRLWLRPIDAPYGIPAILIEARGADLIVHQESDTRRAKRP